MENKILIDQLQTIKKFKNQRICWMRSSLIISAIIGAVLISWNWLVSHHLIYTAAVFGLVVAAVWWYWTMSIIKTLIKHREKETSIIAELILDVREMKESLRKLG
jgi:ABC-type bacteriocin/lantibiotic exporter with double-glycine peptidase domain